MFQLPERLRLDLPDMLEGHGELLPVLTATVLYDPRRRWALSAGFAALWLVSPALFHRSGRLERRRESVMPE